MLPAGLSAASPKFYIKIKAVKTIIHYWYCLEMNTATYTCTVATESTQL